MSYRVTCTNADDVQIEFAATESAEFFLEDVEGIFEVKNKISSSENTMTDGSTYQGSITEERNIVINGFIDDDYINRRNYMYKVFKPKSTGTFLYYEDDEVRSIDYKVESVYIDPTEVVRHFKISLKCTDPFFKDLSDIEIKMAGWQSLFEFTHEFLDEKEELGTRIKSIIKPVDNDSAADYIGITVAIEADGPVINPALYHIEQDLYIKIGTANHPLNLALGDQVLITTETNAKNVYLIRDGVKTNINEYLDENSEFIQLVHGTNTFKYDADSGIDYMNVTISYRFRYLGV